MTKPTLAAFLFLMSAVACKQGGIEISTTAYIVGPTNDIIPVDKDSEPKVKPPVLNFSVMIATRLKTNRVKFCSGTLIAPDPVTGGNMRVLSNHHCFADQDADGKATQVISPESCVATTAYFGFTQANASQAWTTPCLPGSLRTNFDGDLGVFTLSQNPPDKFQPAQFWDGDPDATGRTALIIHYPDVEANMAAPPEGGVKLPTAAVTLTDCKVLGGFAINEWELDRTLPFALRHTCDLIHGSSGSGLIDVETGKLLGVNWGGIKISFDSGVRTDNVATRASYAKAFLTNTIDQAVKEAEGKKTTRSSIDATQNVQVAEQAAGPAGKAEKKRCGAIGGNSRGATTAGLVALLLLPLATALARTRRRSLVLAAAMSTSTAFAQQAPMVGPPAPPSVSTSPQWTASPPMAWAAVYLLNAAFVAEYWSVASAIQGEAPRQQFLKSDAGRRLWTRASFAYSAARAKSQNLGGEAGLSGLLAQHAKLLGVPLLFKDKSVPVTLVTPTITDPALRAHWENLQAAYASPSPLCPIAFSDVKQFAAHQKALADGGRGISPQSLIQPVQDWDLPKIQCLLFTLMAASPEMKAKDGFEPLLLLRALQQANSPLARDGALRALSAVRFLQLGLYPEALRAIMDLADTDPAFRVPYELVQRVFSIRQRGDGSVALQGL